MMDEGQLKQIMPRSGAKAAIYAAPLTATMEEFGIDTPQRQASFIAQVAHESGQLVYVKELASGSAYEGRADLGNTQPGDGVRYKGRGLIQITGRDNYIKLMLALGIDCVADPTVVETPVNACRSAAWFWQSHNLNALADANDQEKICRRINGGLNGLDDRLAFYAKAKEVLC
jgi:putative chitinase